MYIYIYMVTCRWDRTGHVGGGVIPPVGWAGPNRAEPLPSQARPSQTEPSRAEHPFTPPHVKSSVLDQFDWTVQATWEGV